MFMVVFMVVCVLEFLEEFWFVGGVGGDDVKEFVGVGDLLFLGVGGEEFVFMVGVGDGVGNSLGVGDGVGESLGVGDSVGESLGVGDGVDVEVGFMELIVVGVGVLDLVVGIVRGVLLLGDGVRRDGVGEGDGDGFFFVVGVWVGIIFRR